MCFTLLLQNLQALYYFKKTCQNAPKPALFWDIKPQKFSGEGHSPLPRTLPRWEEEYPSDIPPPSAPPVSLAGVSLPKFGTLKPHGNVLKYTVTIFHCSFDRFSKTIESLYLTAKKSNPSGYKLIQKYIGLRLYEQWHEHTGSGMGRYIWIGLLYC